MAVQTAPVSPAAGPAPAAATVGTEEPAQEGEQDLESLARQVYRLIRQRLAVERERELGRL
jgi:hypothetical protein